MMCSDKFDNLTFIYSIYICVCMDCRGTPTLQLDMCVCTPAVYTWNLAMQTRDVFH